MKGIILIIVFVVLCAVGGAGYYYYQTQFFKGDYSMTLSETKTQLQLELDDYMSCRGMIVMNRDYSDISACVIDAIDRNKENEGTVISTARRELRDRYNENEDLVVSDVNGKAALRISVEITEQLKYMSAWMEKNAPNQ